jgi:hypothetical protein
MSFSLSGSTITQSGTDTSLAGLNGIAGVTTTTIGYFTRYDIGSLTLSVTGTLSWNTGSTLHQLRLSPANATTRNSIIVQSGGSITIGVDQNINLHRKFGFAAISQDAAFGTDSASAVGDTNPTFAGPNPFTNVYALVYVRTGGTFLCYGQNIETIWGWDIAPSSTVTFKDSYLQCDTIYAFTTGLSLINTQCSFVQVDGSSGFFPLLRSYTIQNLTQVRPFRFFSVSSASPANLAVSISGVPDLPNTVNLIGIGRTPSTDLAIVSFYNLARGTDYAFDYTSFAPRYYRARLYQQVAFTVSNSAGSAIQSASVRVLGKSGSTWSGTTNVSGQLTLDVELAQVDRSNNTGTVTYYSKNNNNTDVFGFEIKSYLHLFSSPPDQVLKNIAVTNIPWTLFDDTGVTQTNTTTVGAYAGISHTTSAFTLSGTLTLSQAYDSRKLYWRNNDSVSLPTIGATTANFGSANITINAASNLPAATAKFTVATTTGTITLGAVGNYSTTPFSVPAAGVVVVAGGGTTTLTGWTFTSGATVNRTSGSATVIVDADQIANITAGTGVTIQSPAQNIRVEVAGAPTGSSIGVFRRSAPLIANTSQYTLASGNNSGNSTLVISSTIPLDTPSSGFVRVYRNDGTTEDRLGYTSYTGSTFTLTGTLPTTYAAGNAAYVGYIDVLGSSTGTEFNIVQYVADRDCVLVVRKGSGTGKIQDVRSNFTITNADAVIPVSGVLDTINER